MLAVGNSSSLLALEGCVRYWGIGLGIGGGVYRWKAPVR